MAQSATSDSLRLPRIQPRLRNEIKQRAQLDYLFWRLDMYLKDHGATRKDRKGWMSMIRQQWADGASYDQVCGLIETVMGMHLTKQLQQIQAIYNERTE